MGSTMPLRYRLALPRGITATFLRVCSKLKRWGPVSRIVQSLIERANQRPRPGDRLNRSRFPTNPVAFPSRLQDPGDTRQRNQIGQGHVLTGVQALTGPQPSGSRLLPR